MAPRVLIAGGGTGGHAVPAVAIAEGIRGRFPGSEFLFVGTARGVEARVVPAAGFRLELISVISLSRSLNASLLRFPFVLIKGFVASIGLARRFRPDLAICTGGYVSGPVGLAAALLRVPLAIHDSNVLPGITLRVLSRFATLVMLGFEAAGRKMGGGARVTVGNPTRMSGARVDRREAREAFGLGGERTTVLVVGGSQGARGINRAVAQALPKLMDAGVQVLWQTGPTDQEAMASEAAPYGDRVATVAFVDDMAAAYGASDLAVTRAGAMTITELNLQGLPAILVPLPTSSENHQEVNARAMEREGWARVILERDLDGETLAAEVAGLVGEPERLAGMAARSGERGEGDAVGRVVEVLCARGILKA